MNVLDLEVGLFFCVYISMCVCVCVCMCVGCAHTIAQHCLVACAQSIPKSHYAVSFSCWQIAWRHLLSFSVSQLLPTSHLFSFPFSLLTLHFTFYVRQHQQVTKCIACQMVYVSGANDRLDSPRLGIVYFMVLPRCLLCLPPRCCGTNRFVLSTFTLKVLLSMPSPNSSTKSSSASASASAAAADFVVSFCSIDFVIEIWF